MIPKFVCIALLASLGTASAAQAGNIAPTASTAPAPGVPPANMPPYVLKNRSAFSPVTEEQRAPFWPIGWAKRKAAAVTAATPTRPVEAPKVVLDPKSFRVTSILLGNPSLAIINGRTYSEGEFIRAPRAAAGVVTATAPAARVRIYRINDGSVALQCQDQIIAVSLQRPELAQRRAEEELLLEDRP